MINTTPFKVFGDRSIEVLAGILKNKDFNIVESPKDDMIFLNYRPKAGQPWQPVMKIKLRPRPPENYDLDILHNKVITVISKYIKQPV